MRAFVTGGSGFVGRNLIKHLLQHNDVVVALQRSDHAASKIQAASGLPPGDSRLVLVRGDLASRPALEAGMHGCNVVYHTAAATGDWGPWEDFHEANIAGVQNMLAAAKAQCVARFVHVGTEAVMIRDEGGVIDGDETWEIQVPRTFYAPYSKSKAIGEGLVVQANDPRAGFTTVVVRPRSVWGTDDTAMLPALIEGAKSGALRFLTPVPLSSTTHVSNLCEALRLAAVKGRGGEVYIVTDGKPLTLEDFQCRYLRAAGVQPPSGHLPLWLVWWASTFLESLPLLGYSVRRENPLGSRQALALMGWQITLKDDKARRELGYIGAVSYDAGFAKMRER